MVSTTQIIESLLDLSIKDRAKISDRLSFLGTEDKPEVSTGVVEVYSAIESVVKSSGGHKSPPFRAFQKTKHFRKFCGDAEVVLDFIKSEFVPKTKIDRMKAVQLVVLAVSRRLLRDEVPVTHMTIVHHIGRAPHIIDEQFPGYRGCGLLRVLLSRSRRLSD